MLVVAPTYSRSSHLPGPSTRFTWFLAESRQLAEHQCQKQNGNEELENCSAFSSQNAKVNNDTKKSVLYFDVPGVKAEDLRVSVSDNILTVEGKRAKGNDGAFATFQRRMKFDHHSMDSAQTTARLSDGVLMITIPKKEEAGPVKIIVTEENPPEEGNDFSLQVPLPGVKVSDLNVEYMRGRVRIQGQRTIGKPSEVQKTVLVDATKTDVENMTGYLTLGVLTIVAPKKESHPEHKVVVQTADDNDEYVSVSGMENENIEVETVPTEQEAAGDAKNKA